MADYALAADLGGTRMRVALVGRDGSISHRHVTPTRAHLGRNDVVDRLVEALVRLASSAEADAPVGVGVSVASPTDPDTGVMYNPPNLPGWDGFSLKPVLEDKLSLKASVANDATLAALAEHRYGAGRGHKNMIYVTVSTGIGGGVIIDGRLYTGSRGFAGELGHITIDRKGPICNCGNAGCLEAMASGTAVARMARERLAAGEPSVLLERADGGADEVSARTVAEAATSGDALASDIMQEVGTNLGIGIVSLLHAFDPEIIVIGGGMSESLELLLPGIAQEVERHAMAQHRGGLRLAKSKLGDDVSLVGAGALAFDAYETAEERP